MVSPRVTRLNMNKNSKIFITLVIAMVVVGTAYFLGTRKNNTPAPTQNADQTANWKTYSNLEEKYSFKYPSTWVPDEKYSRPGYFHDIAWEQSFDVYIVSNVDTYEAWVNGRETSKIKEPQNIQVDNLPALKIVGQGVLQGGTDFYNIDTVVKYNGKVLNLGGSLLSHSTDKIEKFNSLYDQILSTFKFTDQIGNYNNDMNDQNNLNILVTNFYKALELQDGKLLFSYFTPPSTDKEKTDFNWLTGADLAGTPIYRAFFRQKISSPKINSTQGINSVFTVKVSDQLLGIPSAGSETVAYTPKPRNVVLTIIKSGDKWLVDKFTDPSNTSNTGNAGSPKYNGFGQ